MNETLQDMLMYVISPSIGIAMLIYVGYCVSNEGMHVSGYGWKTKEESPFHYWLGAISLTILGLFMIVQPFIRRFLFM